MAARATHKWAFKPGMRAGAYSWKSSTKAIEDDGVDYLVPIAHCFGQIAALPALMNLHADRDLDMIEAAWADHERFIHVPAGTLTLSCLLEAGRYDELLALLARKKTHLWDTHDCPDGYSSAPGAVPTQQGWPALQDQTGRASTPQRKPATALSKADDSIEVFDHNRRSAHSAQAPPGGRSSRPRLYVMQAARALVPLLKCAY